MLPRPAAKPGASGSSRPPAQRAADRAVLLVRHRGEHLGRLVVAGRQLDVVRLRDCGTAWRPGQPWVCRSNLCLVAEAGDDEQPDRFGPGAPMVSSVGVDSGQQPSQAYLDPTTDFRPTGSPFVR